LFDIVKALGYYSRYFLRPKKFKNCCAAQRNGPHEPVQLSAAQQPQPVTHEVQQGQLGDDRSGDNLVDSLYGGILGHSELKFFVSNFKMLLLKAASYFLS